MTVLVDKNAFLEYAESIDKRAANLMFGEKSVEYSAATGDHLSLENRMAKLMETTPEIATLGLLAKHITALFIQLEKHGTYCVKLDKLDERIIDACNMLKILGAFVHERRKRNEQERQTGDAAENVRPRNGCTLSQCVHSSESAFRKSQQEESP